jgi:hypothetical protein
MGTPIMDGEDLHVFVIAAPVDLYVVNPQIGEMDVLIEVREVVFERPLLDLPLVPIRVSVVVVAIPIALVEPLLILALELVVQDDALDVGVAFVQALSDAQVSLVYLRVVFELALAFEARIELLARVVVVDSMGLQQVPAAVGQNDGDIAPAVQPHGVDQTLLAEVPKVAAAGIGLAPGMVAQLTRGHHPKRANGGQRAGLRAAQRVLAFTRVVHNLSLASTWQVEVAHKYVARVTITRIVASRISVPLRPSFIIAITRVGV